MLKDTSSFQLNSAAVKNGLLFALCFLGWTISSVISDTKTKTLMKIWDFPITILLICYAVNYPICKILGKFIPTKSSTFQQQPALRELIPLALFQVLGFYFTYVSYSRTSIAFSQTVKSSDPLFNIFVGIVFTGAQFSLREYMCLIPVILGILLTSATDVSFELMGFAVAATSNLMFSLRTMVAGPVLKKYPNSVVAYGNMSLAATTLLIPMYLCIDFPVQFGYPPIPVVSSIVEALGFMPKYQPFPSELVPMLCAIACMNLVYCLLSFLLISLMTPLSYSVVNIMRRLGVIISTMIIFQQPPSYLTVIGMIVAFSGVTAYTLVANTQKEARKIQ